MIVTELHDSLLQDVISFHLFILFFIKFKSLILLE